DGRIRRELGPREGGHVLAHLDARHDEPAVGQRDRRLAGATADLGHMRAGRETAEPEHVVYHLRPVAGPRGVVGGRDVVERHAARLAFLAAALFGHALRSTTTAAAGSRTSAYRDHGSAPGPGRTTDPATTVVVARLARLGPGGVGPRVL